ncbi:MAG: DUF2723 domain-containing protein [Crocinitomicaceae bacterium]|nr:DUF2723 domain-containing protein [Crocinitomicaceae bacterium]
MNYKKLNIYLGWLVFLIATIVYFITIESTVSLWDCGEYITAAYKLEVGHPPGAPLFMLLGRLFSFFAQPSDVAMWINRMSALSSSATILFTFWSITMLAKKMVFQNKRSITKGEMIAVLASGFIGAMAYTFSDSFWFSAVEGEVYAMSSLFTAMIFWAILKWDEEMDSIKHGEIDGEHSPMRWMILIMFLFGLAIGVHLLGLLVVPAIAYVVYFNQWDKIDIKGFFLTGIIGVFALGFIQEGIIPGTISWASKFEIAFVNNLGLPFYIGGMFFFLLLIGLTIFFLRWTRKTGRPILNVVGLGFIVFLIGYGSFATIVIRSNANPPLDENDPENLVTLYSYLKREQYGSWPIVYGPYWNSEMGESSTYGDRSKSHARMFVVLRAGTEVKAFKSEEKAKSYAKELGRSYEVVEKYHVTNEDFRKNQEPTYIQNTIFPRMFWSQEGDNKINGYKDWSGYNGNTEKLSSDVLGTDGKRLPRFSENLTYFARYQINWMYWRYFMWNFAGRQNDIQGHGDQMRGNWLSGISAIDEMRLGAQGVNEPTFTTNNPSNNKMFFLPFILGLIGMVFHFYRAKKDAFIVFLMFIFTGLAIVIYLNQKPFEPRERDYAYAASFYAFSMWIGLGVFALFEAFRGLRKNEIKGFGIVAAAALPILLIMDVASGDGFPVVLSWLFICAVAAGLIALMSFLGKKLKGEEQGAYVALALTLVVPFIMAFQGWDDHNRNEKTSARDLAYNYLMSCEKNAILFTNGDNDTFPLWYLQEVEGKRTDVRVCNLSLMGTDWYSEQMKMRAYDSDPLPIKFDSDQILMYSGGTDQVYFLTMLEMMNIGVPNSTIEKVYNMKIKYNQAEFMQSFAMLKDGMLRVTNTLAGADASVEKNLINMRMTLSRNIADPTAKDIIDVVDVALKIFNGYSSKQITGQVEGLQQMQQSLTDWERSWDYLPIEEAMEFTRDDKNMFSMNGRSSSMRIFPSKGFILPVDLENAVKSGILTEKEKSIATKSIRFMIDKQYLTREQVMMMDILANNHWKRGIYFSSPYGSAVSIALYQAGFVKQNGLTYELSPIKMENNNPISKDKMYNNLMNVYDYGQMNKPGVLTDYYTRRHTSQYRSNFARLAEVYIRAAEMEENKLKSYKPEIARLRSLGNARVADSLENTLKNSASDITEFKKKAIDLVKKSIAVMPIKLVIDYGEPASDGRRLKGIDGGDYSSYTDGSLHDYVGLLYRAGDKVAAEKLGIEVAREIETIFNYFENSSAMIMYRNREDLIAALNNYMTIAMMANDAELSDPKGAFATRLNQRIGKLYQVVFESKYNELKDLASASGESKNAGYGSILRDLKGQIDAIGAQYGYVARPQVNAPAEQGGMTQQQFEQMMKSQE